MDNQEPVLKGDFRYRQRSQRDRRSDVKRAAFPVSTLDGYMVYKDRRSKPERRIQNIGVSEVILNEANFRKLFNNN